MQTISDLSPVFLLAGRESRRNSRVLDVFPVRMATTRIFDAHTFTATFRLNIAVRVKFENRCREVVAQ